MVLLKSLVGGLTWKVEVSVRGQERQEFWLWQGRRLTQLVDVCFWSLKKKTGQEIEICELCANR